MAPEAPGPNGMANRVEQIRERLRTGLRTAEVEVIDDSHLHVGHAGARDGRGHFRVRIVSADFHGLSAVRRHQLVYRSLGALMQTDIHALGVTALTPEEAARQHGDVVHSFTQEDPQ